MNNFKYHLPQLGGDIFLTDAGIETTLIFQEGFELPYFAAFDLLKDHKGTEALRNYFRGHAAIARDASVGFILESATWRASADWGDKLGYSAEELAEANRKAIVLLRELQAEFQTKRSPMVISGCVGPRGDGYVAGEVMSVEEAEAYHAHQIRALVISFTVETDGRLPTGETLKDAIGTVDQATGNGPVYFMINCAHPTHFDNVLDGGAWIERIRGIRANASKCSHAELNEAEVLDAGNPVELGEQYRDLRNRFKHINVLGGCCGTDHRHIEQICISCMEAA